MGWQSVFENPRKKGPLPVFAFYDGKVVDMAYVPDLAGQPSPSLAKASAKRRFSLAGMRVLDNAQSGYIIEGDRVYSVSREYRMARLVKGDAAAAVLAEVAAARVSGPSDNPTPVARAMRRIRAFRDQGMSWEAAAREFASRYPNHALDVMDRVGSWSSSEPEIRALQKVWR